jgi:hypothetical protein
MGVVSEDIGLMKKIRKRQSRWLDLVTFGEGILEAVMEGRLLGN